MDESAELVLSKEQGLSALANACVLNPE
jgi:hypothetical protein